jgi:hypothetical protein
LPDKIRFYNGLDSGMEPHFHLIFFNKTTSKLMCDYAIMRYATIPYIENVNEVMRLKTWGASPATEVVLLEKLG